MTDHHLFPYERLKSKSSVDSFCRKIQSIHGRGSPSVNMFDISICFDGLGEDWTHYDVGVCSVNHPGELRMRPVWPTRRRTYVNEAYEYIERLLRKAHWPTKPAEVYPILWSRPITQVRLDKIDSLYASPDGVGRSIVGQWKDGTSIHLGWIGYGEDLSTVYVSRVYPRTATEERLVIQYLTRHRRKKSLDVFRKDAKA